MNKQLKFRVWDKLEKRFIYPDKGYQGHYVLDLNGRFQNLQNGSGGNEYVVQRFIGILDQNLKEIYERDVVKFFTLNGEELGEVLYSTDSCAYHINDYPIMNLDLASLEIVGNMVEDYMWDESGERLVKIYEDANP
jgi:hypothetical protein